MDLETMTLERLMGWLREHPDEARALMRRNESYIFFREAAGLGAGGRTHRRGRHSPRPGPEPRGRPEALVLRPALLARGPAAGLPRPDPSRCSRLMVAQDTGSAIVGPARGDFFVGSGAAAGTQAGLMRHATRFVVLRPGPEVPSCA